MTPFTLELTALAGLRGKEVAVSNWVPVTQRRIDASRRRSTSEQMDALSPASAAAESPFETTIAHGLLVYSLINSMLAHTIEIAGPDGEHGLDR